MPLEVIPPRSLSGASPLVLSVGCHLTAYGGRDDSLFREAIMESGGSISPCPMNVTGYQSAYDSLVEEVNCSQAVDTLQCLREAPFEALNLPLNTSSTLSGSGPLWMEISYGIGEAFIWLKESL